MSKKITLLGSTGSIGTQSLDVIRAQGYEVFGLSAHSHVEKILQQIEEFHPKYVCMTDPDAAARLDAALSGRAGAPKLLTGPEGLRQLAALDGPDVVLNSVVGIAGLGASLTAIESGHDLALANKESLVTGGHLVTRAVAQHGVKLLPVDSEHSAIFQCLQDKESAPSLTKILLTASGGPFFGMKTEELRTKTKADALKHPNWNMGAKITIDSATLMNKGLELIEAVWLFGLPPEEGIGIPLNEAPVWQRMLVMVAGAVMNFVLGFVVLLILLTAQSSPLTSKVIYAVEDGALCGQTGLQAGDEIVAVNGRRCFVANDIIYELVRTEQYRADFTVLRDGQTVELPDVQFDTWTDEAGQVHMSLGFTVYGLAKTPRNVLREAGNSMLYYGRIIFTSLADLLRGRESINNLSGPVGIVTAIGQAASYGWQDLLQMLALITINLGILNLLPFPALDGGKVVFLAIEGITGHAVPEKLQGSLTVAAFALLFGLMIFATYNDIIRLITGAV